MNVANAIDDLMTSSDQVGPALLAGVCGVSERQVRNYASNFSHARADSLVAILHSRRIPLLERIRFLNLILQGSGIQAQTSPHGFTLRELDADRDGDIDLDDAARHLTRGMGHMCAATESTLAEGVSNAAGQLYEAQCRLEKASAVLQIAGASS